MSDAYSEFEDSEHSLKLGNLLASAYRFNNELDRSINLYNKLIEESDNDTDPVFRAGLEQKVAVVYEMLGDTKSAMERYYNSLEIAENKPDTTLLILVNYNIGELYRKDGDIDLAEQFIMKSLVLSKDQNLPDDISRAYNNLGLVSRMKQDYDQALDYYRMSLEIAVLMGIPEMESLYKQMDSQKKELSKLNETKDKLFSILDHDLRSPISKLQSLVMLLREDEADEIDTDQVLSKVELDGVEETIGV